MLIKIDNPLAQLPTYLTSLYIFIGEEPFLQTHFHRKLQALLKIKVKESEHTRFFLEKPSDWAFVQQEYSQYSLFSTARFLDLRYARAKLDKEGNHCLHDYLKTKPPETLMLLQAPLLNLKQIQSFVNDQTLTILQFASPREQTLLHWIKTELQQNGFTLDRALPSFIIQYTQGNLLACAQLIEKISLSVPPKTHLSLEAIEAHLFPQGQYAPFEWSQAILQGDLKKSLLILDYLLETKTEPALLLWILSQEIHQCIQFLEYSQRLGSFQAASKQLKLWSSKAERYQIFLKRKSFEALLNILEHCHQIDLSIKNNQNERRIAESLAHLLLDCCSSQT